LRADVDPLNGIELAAGGDHPRQALPSGQHGVGGEVGAGGGNLLLLPDPQAGEGADDDQQANPQAFVAPEGAAGRGASRRRARLPGRPERGNGGAGCRRGSRGDRQEGAWS
jgi:hypothetical protein